MVDIPQRSGIGGPVMLPADPTASMLGLATVRGGSDGKLYAYSLAQLNGLQDASAPAVTWDLSSLNAAWRALGSCVLPDGRVLVSGGGGAVARIYEIAANAPFVSGVPPFREVYSRTTATVAAIGQLSYGDVLAACELAAPSGSIAMRIAPSLVGWPNTVAANGLEYTTDDSLNCNDVVCDPTNPGFFWSARFTGSNNVQQWDVSGAPGAIVAATAFSGSNWSGCAGVAVDASGSLAVANYTLNRLQVLAPPFVSGNPAPTRSLTSTAADTGANCVAFARNGDVWILYFDTRSFSRFTAAQYAAGGPQAPVQRIVFPFTFPNTFRLGNDVGVRR